MIAESGVLLVDKPSGLSSAAVLNRLKRNLRIKKIGHAGTLDPMATGLLVCLTNGATRLASYAESGTKRYTGVFRLGLRTSTDDVTGEVLSTSTQIPDFALIERQASTMLGLISQRPPAISAVKVNGKRAYTRARAGEEFTLAEREARIDSFALSKIENCSGDVRFDIQCGKGTYIRSLARDLGEHFGCGGCVAELRRELSHPFSVAEAKNIDQLSASDLLPWERLFPQTQVVSLDQRVANQLAGGDTRAFALLEAAVSKQHTEGANSQRVIYADRSTGKCLGLVSRVDAGWKFNVNIGN